MTTGITISPTETTPVSAHGDLASMESVPRIGERTFGARSESFLMWIKSTSDPIPPQRNLSARERWLQKIAVANAKTAATVHIPESPARIAETQLNTRALTEGQLRSIRSV